MDPLHGGGGPTAESNAGSSSLATLAPPRPPKQTVEMAQQVARGGAAETLAAGTSLAPTVVAALEPPMGYWRLWQMLTTGVALTRVSDTPRGN